MSELTYDINKTEVGFKPGTLLPGANILDDDTKYIPPYLNLNLDELKAINSDSVAYLRVPGTLIDHPVVQTMKDLTATSKTYYYLNKNFRKKNSAAGWVFADPRNNFDTIDTNRNTIIYAHNRKDGSMFGTLYYLSKPKFYKESNGYITLTTSNKMTVWKVFSYYVADVSEDYTRVKFKDDDAFMKYYTNVKKKNIVEPLNDVQITAQDKVLTLSTCKNDTERIVVCAKLIGVSDIEH